MKRFRLSLVCLFVLLLLCACDSTRNQIIADIFSTATQTATMVPPTPTSTATAVPTATPTPTAQPDTSLIYVDSLIQMGDYDQALNDLSLLYDEDSSSEQSLRASIDLAHIYYLQQDFTACTAILTNNISKTEDQALLRKMWYQNAQCNHALEQHQEEIISWQKFLQNSTDSPLSSDVYENIAHAYLKLEDAELAKRNFEEAMKHNTDGSLAYIQLAIADCYAALYDSNSAIETLLDLSSSAPGDYINVTIDYKLGNEYLKLGQTNLAYASYLDAVNNYPQYYDSYLCLLALLEANQPVSEYQRGLINYYVGQYSLAAEAFHRYIKAEPQHDGSAWYFIGLCQMFLADYDTSTKAFQTLIDQYPDNRYYVSCWDELSYVQWYYQDNHQQAAATLQAYVAKHPDQTDAAGFLYEAGRILERGNYLSEASKLWSRLIDEYPLYENSSEALFFSALCLYRVGYYESALASLNRLLTISAIPDDQARAHFWIAKVYQKKGDAYNSNKYYQLTADDAPAEYYSLRAAEILHGKAPLTFPENYSISFNLEQEKQLADQWMKLTFHVEDQNALLNRSAYEMNSDYSLGIEYYSLGEYEKALACFDKVRLLLEEDPIASYSFLQQMLSFGMYRAAVFTSRQILTSAGLIENSRTLDVPNYFSHIRYGNWYSTYVDSASQKYGIHPFLIYSIMRQESMYDPWIVSSANARGLMQIMPATGQEINQTLHWPANYTEEDLNRVPVAINFAASYLARQNIYFESDNFAMLSAYNAGPGNTRGWVHLADNDPDLFAELIRFSETRSYLKNVYQFAKIYELLYAL